MKRKIIAAIGLLLAFCLAGCSFSGVLQEAANPAGNATLPSSIPQIEQPTAATVPSSDPTETGLPTTEPTQGGTEPLQILTQPEPGDEDFVKVETYIPDIVIDLRYATEDNFTKQQIYGFTDVWLRYGTVKKLMQVQEALSQNGYRLKIWDGFRPPSAQFKLWDICPDPTYVSDPNNGFSSHSRGNTVDITIVNTDGVEAVMPTGFDDFSKLADRDYSDCGEEAADNALFLEQLMIGKGFQPYSGEWWHFTDMQSYPVEQEFEPVEAALYYADCNEYISLRSKPSTSAEIITKIPAGEEFKVVAKCGAFAMVEYQSLFGYVLRNYIQPSNGI